MKKSEMEENPNKGEVRGGSVCSQGLYCKTGKRIGEIFLLVQSFGVTGTSCTALSAAPK